MNNKSPVISTVSFNTSLRRAQCVVALVFFLCLNALTQTTIEIAVMPMRNDGINGGTFSFSILIKGTNLPPANTLASARIDIYFDSNRLAPVLISGNNVKAKFDATIKSSYLHPLKYIVSDSYVRFSISGDLINFNYDETPVGFDITSSYQTLVTPEFTILDNSTCAHIVIATSSLAVGLFESHNNDDFSGLVVAQTMSPPFNPDDVPLPVELTFNYAVADWSRVTIRWTTATEANNFGFNVERKVVTGSDWTKVGFVAGKGSSTTPTHYSFVDEGVAPGTYNYRLQQVDKSGASKYSSVMTVDVGSAARAFTLADNYPNPFNPTTNIEFTLPSDGHVTLKVYNTVGQEVATLFDGQGQAGKYIQAKFDASRLASGIYFARLQYGGKSLMKKMLLVK